MADCKNMQCPFRVNETSNVYRCDCTGCENRYGADYIARNRDFVYTLARTSLATNTAASAFNAMSVAMADLARALDEIH